MDRNLKWPKYGYKLVIVTIFEFLATTVSCSVLHVYLGIERNLSFKYILLAIAGLVPLVLTSCYILFNMIFFMMTWIEQIGKKSSKYADFNIIPHTEKCLKLFGTLQDGLG